MPPRWTIPTNPNAATTEQNMQQMLEVLRQQTALLAQDQYQQQQPSIVPVTFSTFQAIHPPEFQGTSDPVVAMAWLKEIEKGFSLVKIEEDQKTEFASYYLKNEASYWWDSRKALEDTEVIPWDRFTELFMDKYFPRAMQNRLELQFLELKQNEWSVSEYEKKFTELARFVPEYVDTEEKRARRFQQGLKPWLRSKVALFELRTYAEVVQKALLAENESELFYKDKEGRKRKDEGKNMESQGQNYKKKPGFQSRSAPGFNKPASREFSQASRAQSVNQPNSFVPDCKVCGKKHTGVCLQTVTCFKCQRKGHYSKDCRAIQSVQSGQGSQRQPGSNVTCFKCGKPGHISTDCKETVMAKSMMESSNQPEARIFQMSMQEAMHDSNVVAGTLPINLVDAKVLIDSGATRSFISVKFLDKIKCEVRPLERILVVEVANQDKIPVRQICPRCRIEIDGCHFFVDLIPFDLGEFDVILGMDWLAEYDAKIECKQKQVRLCGEKDKEVIFQGYKVTKQLLTIMEAKKLLQQGCEGYLAHVVDMEKQAPKIEDIPVVNEFLDVFPEDLPGLPPDRQVEFSIDLAPGTEPISKAPYRMAPVEMKELAT